MSGYENIKELQRRVEIARAGGSEKAREKHQAQGKILVRDRLAILFDDGKYLEDGLLVGAARGMPGDAVVTAIGKVNGQEVAVVANDMTIKAGTWGYHTFRKIVRMQEIAVEAKMPIIYLVDSAGARIDSQFDCYLGRIAWGNIFYTQVQISGVVPQVCVMFGPSPAGSAYVPALCDLVIMVDKQATAYLGSPRLAEMAIGEKVTEEQMGGARMHCAVSGLGDYLALNEEEALKAAADYLRFFPNHNSQLPPLREARLPASSRSIAEIVPADQNRPFDVKELVEALVDEGSIFEVKAMFATTKAFLDHFNLQNLDDLPPLAELRELEPDPILDFDDAPVPEHLQALADESLEPEEPKDETSFRTLLVELDSMEEGLKTDFDDLLREEAAVSVELQPASEEPEPAPEPEPEPQPEVEPRLSAAELALALHLPVAAPRLQLPPPNKSSKSVLRPSSIESSSTSKVRKLVSSLGSSGSRLSSARACRCSGTGASSKSRNWVGSKPRTFSHSARLSLP